MNLQLGLPAKEKNKPSHGRNIMLLLWHNSGDKHQTWAGLVWPWQWESEWEWESSPSLDLLITPSVACQWLATAIAAKAVSRLPRPAQFPGHFVNSSKTCQHQPEYQFLFAISSCWECISEPYTGASHSNLSKSLDRHSVWVEDILTCDSRGNHCCK